MQPQQQQRDTLQELADLDFEIKKLLADPEVGQRHGVIALAQSAVLANRIALFTADHEAALVELKALRDRLEA